MEVDINLRIEKSKKNVKLCSSFVLSECFWILEKFRGNYQDDSPMENYKHMRKMAGDTEDKHGKRPNS